MANTNDPQQHEEPEPQHQECQLAQARGPPSRTVERARRRRRRASGGVGRGRLGEHPEHDTVRPIVITESGVSAALVTLRPFSCEPFVEPRSRTCARAPSQRISTCLRVVPVSSTVMSASLPRPMTVRAFTIG